MKLDRSRRAIPRSRRKAGDRMGAGHVEVGGVRVPVTLEAGVDSHGQSRQCDGFLLDSDMYRGGNP